MGIRKKSALDSEEDMANWGRDGCKEEVARPKKHIKALKKTADYLGPEAFNPADNAIAESIFNAHLCFLKCTCGCFLQTVR